MEYRTQIGGRLLGSGVYGCTFSPAPPCAGGSVFRTIDGVPAVGKVTAENTTEELDTGRKIMALPLASHYFALPSKECRPAAVDDEDKGSCAVLTDAGSKQLSMLIMPAAGEQLLKWARDLVRLADHYERLFVHLLEGMVIYQGAGYVHNDIHMGNVLVDSRGTGRYIDFGLAFRPEDVKKWDDTNMGRTFRPKHVWPPPEIQAWRMYLNGVRLVDGLKVLRELNKEYTVMEHQFPTRPTAETAMTAFLASPYVQRADMPAYVRRYGFRLDSWRLGLTMWFLWDDLLRGYSGIKETRLWARRDIIRRVLGGLTEFDPERRLTAAAALLILDPTNRLAQA
jgi:serine/threonine protein kinase